MITIISVVKLLMLEIIALNVNILMLMSLILNHIYDHYLNCLKCNIYFKLLDLLLIVMENKIQLS